MPISYQVLKDKMLVIITSSGDIGLQEAILCLDQMNSDAEYSSEYNLLWDSTERASIFTYDEMQKLLRHVKRYKGDKLPKRAIVVSKSVNYGMARVYDSLITMDSKVQVKIFYNRTEALNWLGIRDNL